MEKWKKNNRKSSQQQTTCLHNMLSWIIILCILYTLILCDPNDLRPRYLIGYSYATKTRYRNSSANIIRCHTIYMHQVYRILSSNFRRTEIGSFRGQHDNSIGIYSSPSKIRHFCSHSVNRNKLMPIMANHSNPEKDGAWSYRVRYSKMKHFGRISSIPSGNVLVSVCVLYYDVPLSTKVAVFRHFDGRDSFSHKCVLSRFPISEYKHTKH